MKPLILAILFLCSVCGALALEPGTYLISCKEERGGELKGSSATHRGYLLTVRDGAAPVFSVPSGKPISVGQVTILGGEDGSEFILSVHFKEGEGVEAEDHILTLGIDDDYGEGVEAWPGGAVRLSAHFGKIDVGQGGTDKPATSVAPKAEGKKKTKPATENRSR